MVSAFDRVRNPQKIQEGRCSKFISRAQRPRQKLRRRSTVQKEGNTLGTRVGRSRKGFMLVLNGDMVPCKNRGMVPCRNWRYGPLQKWRCGPLPKMEIWSPATNGNVVPCHKWRYGPSRRRARATCGLVRFTTAYMRDLRLGASSRLKARATCGLARFATACLCDLRLNALHCSAMPGR